jgi:hypothetical protein
MRPIPSTGSGNGSGSGRISRSAFVLVDCSEAKILFRCDLRSEAQNREVPVGSVIKKRRKRMAKKKHRKLLRKTRHQRRNKK